MFLAIDHSHLGNPPPRTPFFFTRCRREALIQAGILDGQKTAANFVRQEDATDTELLTHNLQKILREESESKGMGFAESENLRLSSCGRVTLSN